MINLDNLRQRIRGGGFQPFTLHLSNGRDFAVPHPEFISVGHNLVVVITEDDVSHTIDPLHIVEISNTLPAKV